MVYIFCALHCEAKQIIEKLGLKAMDVDERKKKHLHFDVYTSEGKVILAITGVGPVNATLAVSEICNHFFDYENKEINFLINIGVAGAKNIPDKSIFIINKICNHISHKDLYPDMIIDSGLEGIKLVTDGKITEHNEMDDDTLYDMEAGCVFEAGRLYFDESQMFFIKIVSDNGKVKRTNTCLKKINITPEDIEKLIEINVEKISNFVCDLIDFKCNKEEVQGQVLKQTSENDINQLFHATKVMQDEINRLVYYSELMSIDICEIINDMKKSDVLPVEDKKEGRKALDELKERIVRFQ